MPMTPPVDGPPPSPATDPAAAKEAGQPFPISQLAGPMAMQPQGPDLSGVNTLIQKLQEGLLTLSGALPMIAPELEQCRSILAAAAGRFLSQVASSSGKPGAGPAPTGQVVSPAGPQFPGAVGPKPV